MATTIRTWALELERRLWRLPPLRVTREEAVAVALATWKDRVGKEASSEPRLAAAPQPVEWARGWSVHMLPGHRPCPRIDVDGQTGEVVEFWSPSR